MEKFCSNCFYAHRGANEYPCTICSGVRYWKAQKKGCSTCRYEYQNPEDEPCSTCILGGDSWVLKNESKKLYCMECIHYEKPVHLYPCVSCANHKTWKYSRCVGCSNVGKYWDADKCLICPISEAILSPEMEYRKKVLTAIKAIQDNFPDKGTYVLLQTALDFAIELLYKELEESEK